MFNITIAGDGETVRNAVKIGDNNLNFVAKAADCDHCSTNQWLGMKGHPVHNTSA